MKKPANTNYAANKRAFSAIMHLNQSTPEWEDKTPTGLFHEYKYAEYSIPATTLGPTSGSRGPTQTTPIDFRVAVQNILSQKLTSKKDLQLIHDCYILGSVTHGRLLPQDRRRLAYVEQRLGRAFIAAGLYPVKKFFKCIRRKQNYA